MDIIDQVLADKDAHVATNEQISTIADLANQQLQLEQECAALEQTLAERKKELDRVQTDLLPTAMMAAGVVDFKLVDGSKISVREVVRCNIKADNKAAAYEWLRANGAEPLIKNKLELSFIRGQDEQAQKAVAMLRNIGLFPVMKEDIPWNTLASWAAEQLEAGKALPDELLGLYVGKKAVIKGEK